MQHVGKGCEVIAHKTFLLDGFAKAGERCPHERLIGEWSAVPSGERQLGTVAPWKPKESVFTEPHFVTQVSCPEVRSTGFTDIATCLSANCDPWQKAVQF